METITQLEARSQGLTRYFTGKPCGKSHISERMVSDRYCCECKRLRERNSQNRKRYLKEHYTKNRDEILEKSKERYEETGPKVEYTKEWRTKNADRVKRYREDNAGLYAFHAAKRRKLVKIATPKWASMDEIKEIYLEAARMTEETGIPHEVDHVIPIKGKRVCGLHCPENLRIIPAAENRSKHNKFISVLH